MTDPSTLSSSFRDPAGFLFRRGGVLYRQVNPVHQEHYDALFDSGLYDELTRLGLLVPHEEVAAASFGTEDAYKVIKPEVVDFISYPYEWSFGQLKDAALATLRIQKVALDKGMSLRDASAYNIQFHRGRPVLIDTLSFEVLQEGEPWVAYRQFCQHFLAPIALMAYRDVRLGLLSRNHIDGVPLDLAARMLPLRTRFRIPLLLHVFLHARSQKKHSHTGGGSESTKKPARNRPFTLQAFKGLIDSLYRAVDKMELGRADSHWVDYYAEAAHYSSEATDHKQELVASLIEQAAPQTVWDLGANTGLFSRIAAAQGVKTIAFEMDPACVEESYRRVKADKEENVLPLVCDLTNPSPGLGWANEERMTLQERGPADLLLALALIHHLAIANNVPLTKIADYFASLGSRLIIEFVPKSDEKVRHLLSSREDVFPDYTRDGFERAFKESFETERVEEIKGSERVLYLMRVR
ncbi:MAG: hypothetical protein QOH26_1248 [Actinomycetota bacterium]|nr:hypothetical protein [Actinomycetota bacterium]